MGKECVSLVHHSLYQGFFFFGERAADIAQIGKRIGLDHIKVDTQLVVQQLFGVGNHAEDTDGAGQCGRLGHNPVGCTRDVIAARSRIVAHRYDNRLCFLQQRHFTPYLFRAVSTSSRRVDAQHYGFHVFIFTQTAQVVYHLFRVDAFVGSQGTVYNLAGCIIYRQDIAALVLRHIALHVYHIFQVKAVQRFVLIGFGQLLQVSQHAVLIHQRICQSGFQVGFGRLEVHVAVCQCVEAVGRDTARCRYAFHHFSPDGIDERLCLFAVGRAHLGRCVRLYRRLVSAYAEDLHFHTYLVEQVFEEHRLGSQTVPGKASLRVDRHFICHACQVISALAVVASVGDDEFPAFLEVEQGVANLLQRCARAGKCSCLDADAFYFFVFLGFTDGAENVVQSIGREPFAQ